MYRFTLTVPLQDNDGRPRPDFPRAAEILLADIGVHGWTSVDGVGAWEAYREPVRVYTVDANATTGGRLLEAAATLAAYADQECVYVTEQEIITTLVAPRTPWHGHDGGW